MKQIEATDELRWAQDAVLIEVMRQEDVWGRQEHEDDRWALILGEEVGELSKAILEKNSHAVQMELTQVCAVAMNWIACMNRRTNSGGT